MNIGIVVAMEKEFNPIANSLSNRDSRAQGHFSITWGNLGPHHVIAILAGIGKVHAALAPTASLALGAAARSAATFTLGTSLPPTRWRTTMCGAARAMRMGKCRAARRDSPA